MIELVCCLIGVPVAVYVVKRFLVGGVRDEFDYPLANCDVSMMEEICVEPEIKTSTLDAVVVLPKEVKVNVQ